MPPVNKPFVHVKVGKDRTEDPSPGHKRREGFVYGIMLVAFGIAVLTERIGVRDLWDWWTWTPYLFMALGIAKILVWESAGAVGSGITTALGGLFWFAVTREWYGLEIETGWPLVLVAIGAGMVAKTVLRPLFPRKKDKESPTETYAGSEADLGGKSHE